MLSNKLTNQERKVLCLAAQGFTDKKIALELGISTNSVQLYWERLRLRLNAASRLHAYAIWIYLDRP